MSDFSMGQNVWECGHGYNKIQETDMATAPSGGEQSPKCQRTCLLRVPSVDGNRHSHLLYHSLPFLLSSQESQESLECDSDLRKGFQLWNFPKPIHSQDRHFLLLVSPAPFSLYPQLIPPPPPPTVYLRQDGRTRSEQHLSWRYCMWNLNRNCISLQKRLAFSTVGRIPFVNNLRCNMKRCWR